MKPRKQVVLVGVILSILLIGIYHPVFGGLMKTWPDESAMQEKWPAVGEGAGYLRFEHLGVQDGLSENTVLTIYQDSQGFMWFGTREGLNKFDGYEFTVYTAEPNNPQALSDDYITAIEETRDGLLCVGTYYGGLNCFDRDNNVFKHYRSDPTDDASLPDERVSALMEDSQGNLWVGTRGGLSMLNANRDGFIHYQSAADNRESISSNDVQSLFEDSKGDLWIGTANGLNLLDRGSDTFTRFLTGLGSGASTVSSIADDGSDGLWIGSQGGLIHFDSKRISHKIYRHNPDSVHSLSSNQINVVTRDQNDDLWIGFKDQGVNLVTNIENEGFEVIRFAHQDYDFNSLSNNNVRSIYVDRGGLLWFGTQGSGINKANLATRAFGFYRHDLGNINSLGGDNITALAFDAARRSLWVGTAGEGLDRMDLITGDFVHYQSNPADENSLANDSVALLHIGPRGNLFVSTEGGELEVYDSIVDGFSSALPESINSGSISPTTAITHDPEGMIWLSQSSGELLRIDPAGDVIIQYSLKMNAPLALRDGLILDIYADPEGIIWLATENQGLVRFDPDKNSYSILERNGTSNGPSHNSITHIFADQSGVLWLGTAGGGVNRYDPEMGIFTYFTTQDGLPSNRVYGIQQDVSGALWLSTGNGLAMLIPVSGEVQTFDMRDGLQGNSFNRNAHAASEDGALFFGGVSGFNAFYPSMIEVNDHIPPVVITTVSLFNHVLATDISGCSAALTLAHDQNFLSFEFAALDYVSPGNNRYVYLMEGLDAEYIDAGNKRHADYPNLPWGEYIFRLLGANSDGIWNNTGACVEIQIQSPFWATWWFISLVGLLLAGSVVVGYRWRLRAIEQQRQRLAVDVFERTMEIERRRQMAVGLSEVVRLLNTNQPLVKSLDFIVKQSVGLTSASKAAIFERTDNLVEVRACYPQGETYLLDLTNPDSPSAHCLLESTFLNRLLIYSRIDPKTMTSDTKWELVSGNYRTALCTPLKADDGIYGGLVLYYGEDRTFASEEINLAHTLADHASLAIANDRLKGKAQSSAVTAERNRLARDLHDAVTQTLFSTSLIAEVLPKLWQKDTDHALKRLEELRQLTRGALGEMRTLLMELRPAALQAADPAELFKHLTDAFTGRTGVVVQVDIDASTNYELPPAVKNVYYRIAQEGLNNIFKHANASQVWFRFNCESGTVTLMISDNGRGFDQDTIPAGRLGLGIMAERAESIGADLTLVSQTGEGTTLRLVWQSDQNEIEYKDIDPKTHEGN